MAAQTPVYFYYQRQHVVLLEIGANARRRYQTVYAKELTISRGVDNLLEFAFINQEQKPVNISGKEITCRILNYQGNEILLQKALVPTLPITGITTLQLTIADIENIPAERCYYSLEIPVGAFDYPVFVDSNGGARGVINIVNSVLPSFVQAKNITIPSHLPPQAGVPRTYYSSVINTTASPTLTVQVKFTNFTGSIQFEGSTIADFSTYYPITNPINFTADSSTLGYTFEGYHPYVRIKIINNGSLPAVQTVLSGDVTEILAR